MRFMADAGSAFRRMIGGARLYPEIPFTVSVGKEQGEVFDRLREIVGCQDEERIEITGKIDLALQDGDGTWRIIDYKTDRMLPADNGSRAAFRERLERQYGGQLEIYRLVMRCITGAEVREAKLLTV